ncbi:TPA: hypothetical protein OT746_003080 [Klebsiella variicola]|nr:hypothetical protein [Klebsiella variicola]
MMAQLERQAFPVRRSSSAKLYVWHNKDNEYYGGCVHAKVAVAVADARECFITSTNLTGYAMGKFLKLRCLFLVKVFQSNLMSIFSILLK